jgi:hypothetical protein
MFKYVFLGFLLAAVAFPFMAHADEKPRFSDSTLELCPEEFAPFEAEWTAECLVNAVRAWNIGALIELSSDPAAFECSHSRPCHEDFVFGPEPWEGAALEKRSIFDMIAVARMISVDYLHDADGNIEAIFYPGWSNESDQAKPELTSANWMNQFFVCAMEFDASIDVWLIADGFCHAEIGTPSVPREPVPREPGPYIEPVPQARSASYLPGKISRLHAWSPLPL